MEIIFHSHANKTHFESEGFGTRKRPISLGMLGSDPGEMKNKGYAK